LDQGPSTTGVQPRIRPEVQENHVQVLRTLGRAACVLQPAEAPVTRNIAEEEFDLARSIGPMGAAPVRAIAKKNHFNPCFWTAHWNPRYFAAVRENRPRFNPRDQHVFVLSVKANKVFRNSVNHVHYDKNLCFAEVTMEAADSFCQRALPNKYETFKQTLK